MPDSPSSQSSGEALAKAIVTVIDSGRPEQFQWTAAQITDELRRRGAMSDDEATEQAVSAALAELAKPGGALRRVREDIFELA